MGADGTGLFADDVAADVRAAYRELVAERVPDDEATRRVLAEFAGSLADEDEEPVVWLALAATQHRLGRLAPDVRDRALDVVDSGRDLARWTDSGARAVRQRTVVLDRLRAQLVGPQPPRRSVRRPPRLPSDSTDLVPGAVLAYLSSPGWLALVHVDGLDEGDRGTAPCVSWLDWQDTQLPSEDELEAVVRAHRDRLTAGGSSDARMSSTLQDSRWDDVGFRRVADLPRQTAAPRWHLRESCDGLARRIEHRLHERPAPGVPDWW